MVKKTMFTTMTLSNGFGFLDLKVCIWSFFLAYILGIVME